MLHLYLKTVEQKVFHAIYYSIHPHISRNVESTRNKLHLFSPFVRIYFSIHRVKGLLVIANAGKSSVLKQKLQISVNSCKFLRHCCRTWTRLASHCFFFVNQTEKIIFLSGDFLWNETGFVVLVLLLYCVLRFLLFAFARSIAFKLATLIVIQKSTAAKVFFFSDK